MDKEVINHNDFVGSLSDHQKIPIEIPVKEGTLTIDTIEQAIAFSNRGEMFKAVTSWFSAPIDARELVISEVIAEADGLNTSYVYLKKDKTLSPKLQFVLGNFSLITSEVAERIFSDDAEVRDIDILRLSDDQEAASDKFQQVGMSAGIDTLGNLFAEPFDFDESKIILHREFSTKDILELIKRVGPRVSITRWIEGTDQSLRIPWGTIVSPITHAELLLDNEVRPYIEDEFKSYDVEVYLANYLAQLNYPSPDFFEELLRLHPDVEESLGILRSLNKRDLPISLYFYTMLRRIEHVDRKQALSDDEKNALRENVVTYLLSDTFMQRALPYLDDDNLYGATTVNGSIMDYFINFEAKGGILYSDTIVATGHEARRIKMQKFGEVLRLAINYLQKQGRGADVEKLKERVVDGKSFSDYISS